MPPHMRVLLTILALAHAAPARTDLVLDIDPGVDHRVGGPFGLAQVGDRAFFGLSTRELGAELWVTEGDPSTTRLVRDLSPGSASGYRGGYIRSVLPFRGQALFLGFEPETGYGLWLSDGTADGTRRVPAPSVSQYATYTTAGDETLYLTDQDEDSVLRLWASDGMPDHPATLIAPGLTLKSPVALSNVTLPDGRLFFWVTDDTTGDELWVTDGRPGGTRRVTDPEPGPEGTQRGGFATFGGGVLFFFASPGHPHTLWFSDGTETGTRVVFRPPAVARPLQGQEILDVGSFAFFDMYDPTLGSFGSIRTFRTDGTPEGTQQLSPGAGGAASGSPLGDGRVVYEPGYSSRGLYITDGTLEGTRRLTHEVNDLRAAVLTGERFVVKAGPQAGFVWSSDGTETGTRRLRQTSDHGLYAFDGRAFFPSDDQPWVTDGTEAGTQRFIEIPSNAASGSPRLFTSLEGAALFRVGPPMTGAIWRSDGTAAGTQLAHDFASAFHLGRAGHSLVYGAQRELFATGPEPGSQRLLGPLQIENSFFLSGDDIPLWANLDDDRIVFRALRAGYTDYEPWVTDGTPEGTILLRDIAPGADGSYPARFQRFGDRVLFLRRIPGGSFGGRWEVWQTDGTPEGTAVLALLPEALSVSQYFAAPEWIAVGDEMLLRACSEEVGIELFRFDLATGRATLLRDIDPTVPFQITCLLFREDYYDLGGPRLLGRVGEKVLFSADDGTGYEPWVSDGTSAGTSRMLDIRPDGDTEIDEVTSLGSRTFFVADNGEHGVELWVTDGTSAGTRMVDIWPGPAASRPRSLNVVSERLFFFATTARGDGLYTSDGTPAGTRRLANGTGASEGWLPTGKPSMAAVGDRLLHPSTTDALGTELHAIDLLLTDEGVPLRGAHLLITQSFGPKRSAARLRAVSARGQEVPFPESVDDPRREGATLVIADLEAETTERIALRASGWRRSRGGYEFPGRSADPCRHVEFGVRNRLVADCAVDAALLDGDGPVAVELWIGSDPVVRHCLRFDAVQARGRIRWQVRDAAAPPACLLVAPEP